MLKKGYFNWLIYFCYAIVLLHNSTPHCHNQVDENHGHHETGDHHHEHHEADLAFDWLNHLFDHHNESISGEKDVFEWLQGDNSILIADVCAELPKDYLFTRPTLFEFSYLPKYFPRSEHPLKAPDDIFLRRLRHCNISSLRAPPVLV